MATPSQANKVCPLTFPHMTVHFLIHDKYFSASTTALVFYEYAITFEDEVSCVVKRPCTSVADSN